MDVEAAYAFLGVPLDERGSLEKLKMRFRKLCLAYHPDKNRAAEHGHEWAAIAEELTKRANGPGKRASGPTERPAGAGGRSGPA